ncbi:MAG TPA: hypothetical protein VGO49_01145 [Bradyrhizobium sp.]|nr:hypothetical protein [Bradyrhizobium sp.]
MAIFGSHNVSKCCLAAFHRLRGIDDLVAHQLGDALTRRNVAPHIFETSADAHQFVAE